ncbi:hypothetical protein Aca07nite_87660 [Actinoplanes capillaceus]|uniref:TadE-like protein n=1 Tax=Actinoplanes campanulatus TaxID=113559 RepID=A0ABQ3WZ94_9ACTN|nr:TadE family protein [Actinoplanes capillaceus]GID51491.1 hypothetical protein Aca07nite_87660 [Actinoplanes capillaceus]
MTPPGRRRWARRRPDRGSTTVEHALWVGAWMTCLVLGAQVVVWALAQLACQYAANHGLQVARVQGGTPAAGKADAAQIVQMLGTNLVDGLQVSAQRTEDSVTITVSGTAAHIFSFLIIPVDASATGPVEELQP